MSSGSKDHELKELTIERATDTCALHSFKCGQNLVDEVISELDDYLSNNNLFLVKDGEEVVALYCMRKDDHSLFLPSKTKERMINGLKPMPVGVIDEDQDYYRSAELSLLAVREDCQRRHIGSIIIEKVMDELVNERVPNREFLIVRALDVKDYSAIPFYRSCGFVSVRVQEKDACDNSVMMYRVIGKTSEI